MSGTLEIIADGRNVEISVTPSAELANLSREFLEEAAKLREACASGPKMKTTANFNFAELGGGEELSSKLNAVLLTFRQAYGHHATALLQTDSERARRTRIAPRLRRCRWMLKVL